MIRVPARLAALAALALLPGCREEARDARDPVRPVLVVDVRPLTEQVFGPFAGTVEPRYRSNQGFRTAGRMIARDVYVGDLVRKGDRLAALDETLLRFALTQSHSDIVNAEAQLKNAAAAEARKRTLIQGGTVAQSDLDSASTEQKTAAAKLDQARAAEAKARDQLGFAALRAEFDGVVTAWTAEVGQDVGEGTGVVTLARPDVREAVVDIPDDLIGRVRERAAFTVALQAANAVTVQGMVREIAPGADPATRTRRVRFTLDSPSDAFRLGSTITVAFTAPIPPRIEIPETAILERGEGAAVWAVAPGAGTVALRPVAVSERADGSATVTSGLGEGDLVVTAGIHRLRDGQAVRVARSFP